MYKINIESMGDVKKYIWHYRKGNKEYGPFTYEDIIEMVKKGEIGPDEYVLKFGNKKFVKVSEVKDLFDIIDQRKEDKAEQVVMSKKDTKEEIKEEIKEETKEEFHAAFESRTANMQAKDKQGAFSGKKAAMIMAGAAGLCLTVLLLKLLLWR